MKKLRLLILTLILTFYFCIPAFAGSGMQWLTNDSSSDYYITPDSYPYTLDVRVSYDNRDDGVRYQPYSGFVNYQFQHNTGNRRGWNQYIYTIPNAGYSGVLTFKKTKYGSGWDPEWKYIHVNQNQSACSHTYGAWPLHSTRNGGEVA